MVLRVFLLLLLLSAGAAYAHGGGKGHCGHGRGAGGGVHQGSRLGHLHEGHSGHDHTMRVHEHDPLRDAYFYPYRVLINNCFNFENAYTIPLYIRQGDYVVYKGDTLGGVITLKNDRVVLAQTDSNEPKAANTFMLDDILLTSVVATGYMGQHDLCLTRINPHDKKMMRVLHSGRMCVYDDRCMFPDAGNIDAARIKIACGGDAVPHYPLVVLDPELYLIKKVNKAYGLDLKKKDFDNMPGLLHYIDGLD